MAVTVLTAEEAAVSGSQLTPVAVTDAGDGVEFDSDTSAILVLINASGGAIVATLETPAVAAGGVAIADPTVSCPAGQTTYMRCPAAVANDPANANRTTVTFDGVTSLTAALIT